MVMGDDSCSKGRGFESRRRILDGHFFTFICCKNCNVCLKKTENKRKRGRGRPKILKNLFMTSAPGLVNKLEVLLWFAYDDVI